MGFQSRTKGKIGGEGYITKLEELVRVDPKDCTQYDYSVYSYILRYCIS